MASSFAIVGTLIASALLGVVAAFAGLFAFGVAVGSLPVPPRSIALHPSIYVPVLRFLVWLPLVALSAFVVTRLARSKAIAFGVVAGVCDVVALLAQIRGSELANGSSLAGLVASYWVEFVLLIAVLPLLCALWRPRAG